jgi:hypothetical protein
MADETASPATAPDATPADSLEPQKPLTEAAKRALAEAEERRRARAAAAEGPPSPEVGGRSGPDPVRYGDWEKDGIISDF